MKSEVPLRLLLSAANYREFLKIFIESHYQKAWGSYAAFSRKVGFSSRSHVTDVIAGKRRLTAKTVPLITEAMGLKSDLRSYFVLLVSVEEEDLRPRGSDLDQVLLKLEKTKERLFKRKPPASGDASILSDTKWVYVFASLGSESKGATVRDICSRTELNANDVEKILAKFCENGFAFQKDGRFFSSGNHLISQAYDSLHREYFIRSSNEMITRAQGDFNVKERLYSKSVFSMKPDTAELFKEQLKELILRFLDRVEDSEGTTLGHLTIAFEANVLGKKP